MTLCPMQSFPRVRLPKDQKGDCEHICGPSSNATMVVSRIGRREQEAILSKVEAAEELEAPFDSSILLRTQDLSFKACQIAVSETLCALRVLCRP